jgi:hypothetical protein
MKKSTRAIEGVLFMSMALSCIPVALPANALAQTHDDDKSVKQDVKDAGHSTKKATTKTGHNIKKGTTKVVHKSARKTADTADKAADKTKP